MAEVAALGLRVDGVSNIDKAKGSLDGFTTSAEKADKSTGQFGKTATGLKTPLSSLNNSLSSAAKSMLALGAATMSLAAVSRTLMGFEESMSQVAAITRANTKELQAMRDMAKQLGATTKFSASEAADGIKFLGMAGFTASESLASIPAVLNLATASAMGLSDAADIATNIMSGFGIAAENAANVADVLAAASSRSNTSVQQLGGAMSTVAPISAALGISLEDTAAAIGTLSDAGIQGERAGTAMRGALASLAGPTTQAQQVLSRLGLTVAEVNPQTNDLATVFGRLRDAGLSTADAMTIFGREAASGALVLTGAAQRVGEFGQELQGAAGEAQRMADIMADNLGGDFKNLQSVTEALIIAMGEAGLTAIMRGVVQLATDLVGAAVNLVNQLGKVTNFIGSALSPAFNVIGHILTTLAKNADAFALALAGLYAPAVLTGIKTLTSSLAVGLVGAIKAVTAAMMANPVGWLIRALAVAGAAVYAFREDIQRWIGIDVVQTFKNMALGAAGALDQLVGWYTGYVAALWTAFKTLSANIVIAFENAFDKVRTDFSDLVLNIIAGINSVFPNLDIDFTPYVGGGPQEYLSIAEAAKEAFEANQMLLGARDALVRSFADDSIWEVGTKAFEDYTAAANEMAGTGEGDGGGGLPGATDALNKFIQEAQVAAASANTMTEAYLLGGEAISALSRQVEIENAVLEHGASARGLITNAIHNQQAALDRLDVAKQINDLREQNKQSQGLVAVLGEQSKGYQQGQRAMAAYNREQQINNLLAGKNAEELQDLIALYRELWDQSDGLARTIDANNELNRLVESTRTAQERYNVELERLISLRPYAQTAEQAEALNRAIDDIQRKNSEWVSFTEDALERMNSAFADMWRDAFDGSKNLFDGMKRGFRQMLAEMAHAAITQPIMISVGNALMGTNKPGGVGDGGGIFSALRSVPGGSGTIGNAAQWLGQKIGSEALTSFGLGLSGTTAATGIASIGTSLGASLGTSMGATAASGFTASFSASIGGSAGAAATGGAAGLGTAIGSALPWVGGALAIASLLGGSFKGEKRYGGGYEWAPGMDIARYSAGPSGRPSAEVDRAIGSMIATAAETINSVFESVGSSAFVSRLAGSAESSEKGRGGTASGGFLSIDGQTYQFGTFGKGTGFGGTSGTLEEMISNLGVDLSHTVIEALQVGINELPSVIQQMVQGIDPSSLTADQSNELVGAIRRVVAEVDGFRSAVEQLPFANLRDLSFDAAANLIQFAGGLDNLRGSLSTYFENFYSQEEQLELSTNRLAKAFADIGYTMPEIGEGAMAAFRGIVESIDLTNEEGQRAYATLISLSGEFANLVTGMDELANATARAAEEAARAAEQQQQAAEQAARSEYERLARVGEYQLQAAISQLNAAWSAVQQHAQKEINRLEQTFSQTDSLWSAYQSRVRDLQSELGGLISTINKSVSDLRGQMVETSRAQVEQARAIISTAIATRQLPQTADLNEAIRIAQQGVSGGEYRTAFEQREANLKLLAELESLRGIAQPELDTAQETLEQLMKQYNRLRGIEDNSSMTVTQLERQLAVAFSTEQAARTQINAINLQVAAAERQYNALLGIGSGINSLAAAFRAFSSAAGAVKDAQTNPINRDQRYLEAKLAQLRRENPNYGGIDWTTATTSDLAAVFRQEGMTPQRHYELHGRYEGLSYDKGTSYVPYDMMADIHQGEIIVDPKSSNILRDYGIEIRGGMSKNVENILRVINGEIREFRKRSEEENRTLIKNSNKLTNIIDTWNVIGMPPEQEPVTP